ncbi:Glucan endo-1,3-beta-glucosidase 1 [Morus notabilis]|uniref:glucan endo-1,3-beta-D-glucosidase n=1 Tax=Morus notabilis TaxID=981085 RepID=W9RX16_9ROSA|nr:Glucan endo-1,3-beta-glucosidase 1 [Morus notabilis]
MQGSVGEPETEDEKAKLHQIPAIESLYSAFVSSNLHTQIKISTPHAASVILDPFPPSQAFFNHSLTQYILPLLRFLSKTGSPLMMNLYPYYVFMQNKGVVPLDNVLFKALDAFQGNGGPQQSPSLHQGQSESKQVRETGKERRRRREGRERREMRRADRRERNLGRKDALARFGYGRQSQTQREEREEEEGTDRKRNEVEEREGERE